MVDSESGKCIETLCHQGCNSVRQAIKVLQAGQNVDETRGLDKAQRDSVLSELKAIMAVYDSDSTPGRDGKRDPFTSER